MATSAALPIRWLPPPCPCSLFCHPLCVPVKRTSRPQLPGLAPLESGLGWIPAVLGRGGRRPLRGRDPLAALPRAEEPPLEGIYLWSHGHGALGCPWVKGGHLASWWLGGEPGCFSCPNKQAPSAPGVICPPKGQKAGSRGMGAPTPRVEDELPISTSYPAGPAAAPGVWGLVPLHAPQWGSPGLPLAVSRGLPQPPPASGQAPASSLPSLPSRTLLPGPPSSLLWPETSCQVLCGVTSRVPAGRWGLPRSWDLSQDSWVDLPHPHALLQALGSSAGAGGFKASLADLCSSILLGEMQCAESCTDDSSPYLGGSLQQSPLPPAATHSPGTGSCRVGRPGGQLRAGQQRVQGSPAVFNSPDSAFHPGPRDRQCPQKGREEAVLERPVGPLSSPVPTRPTRPAGRETCRDLPLHPQTQ
ncbi:PREDICTED: brain-specific angiogenesis inhibitor 1-associated protein 2 isoform X4 [Rhinopithecus bieti]|uniref:brain-specific angiogenesis inhibitor 1-associated protein 2 isoform X4 n=1 Tax=Rhinopithecus bieti TaxID=61621 RepID=UPI00083C8AE2|nr:PREDICTED: brain-specific angiogenesis inhibitor 1-associated protein 2 isoform X4 [Rhinopithecus bieti]